MPNPLLKAGYREFNYEDEQGRRFAVLLPPGVPESEARTGVLLGPVMDLGDLGLPSHLEVALHNALHSRRVFTYEDARARSNDVQGALMTTLKVDARRVIESYRVAGVD